MAEHILIGVAWPYANGPLHLGHVAGAYLPADIFARYHRLKGNKVLMVSGSDQHGAPITIRAEEESTSPQEIASRYDGQFRECWQKLGISFDLFTSTSTVNHTEVTHDIFLTLLKKGYIYKDTILQAYCPHCQRFLPDRYLEGVCPYCGFDKARGDQCEACGRPMNPFELKDLRCHICSATPQFRSTEHFFLRLSAFQKQLEEWIGKQSCWRRNVMGATWKFLNEGLKDRAITRDLGWGISVPQDGFEDKRIYVWFEAVIGYLSASKEWAKLNGDEAAWQPFWTGESKSFYFVGKDNIFFHTLVWPAMLLGYGSLNLPYNVPGNEFLTIEGQKLSTSRRWAVWLPDYLDRYHPDPLRYMLSVNMPETSDSDFSWREFLRRNNNELVATYGNLIHRVLSFTYRNFGGAIPVPGCLDVRSRALMQQAANVMGTVDDLLYRCNFKGAIREAMSLAQEANQYLDEQAPWKKIKEDRQASAMSTYTVLSLLSALKIVLYPFLPFSSEKLHYLLGFKGNLSEVGWKLQKLEPGQKIPEPCPVFVKLDDAVVDEEEQRLGMISME